jgi:hypothetical protein
MLAKFLSLSVTSIVFMSKIFNSSRENRDLSAQILRRYLNRFGVEVAIISCLSFVGVSSEQQRS